ncbi:hypothetical protein [Nitrosomonas communis]|uniref:Uncharacterized protein n=1 Tax=Nitrosomonas communis TaxID=44574 RepID=A0A1I4P6Q2_9PROT|nr:hypothetical protein [Nitrosomonas communis]SFM23534.1 hypothetical protein SAMN05421863_101843 [Nitrosomonas communis]
MKKRKLKILTLTLVTTMLVSVGQSVLAHTRLDIPTMTEGTRAINHLLGHTCGENNAIGTSVVFPDGIDSTILVNGQPHSGPITDFLTNYGNNAQLIFNRAVFDHMDEKTDPNGNVVGFWAGGGPGVPHNLTMATQFRLTAPSIEPASCANSVKVYVSIATICKITGVDQFGVEGVVDLWTHNNLGTPFDRVSAEDDGPAPLTINRDLTKNPLPSSCSAGVDVEVKPSAAQINRDMPIKFEGQQVWPQ